MVTTPSRVASAAAQVVEAEFRRPNLAEGDAANGRFNDLFVGGAP